MFTFDRKGAAGATPRDAIPSMAKLISALDGEVVIVTCIHDDGCVGDSECFTSLSQPKNLLPVHEIFHLARAAGVPRIIVSSRSSGPIDELHDCDVDFTARVLDLGRRVGIRVCEHVLVDKDATRLMTESAPHLWEERGMTIEWDRDEAPEESSLDPDGPASADLPGEGADRQGDPDPGEETAGQSERAKK